MLKRSSVFSALIAISFMIPALVACLPSNRDAAPSINLPYELDGWTGTDLKMSKAVARNYRPLDVKLLLRSYKPENKPPVDCVIQEATNIHQVHDLFACLNYSGGKPKRLGTININDIGGSHNANLFEYTLHRRKYVALFSYQSKAGSASYPPNGFLEQMRLAVVGRVPCRLMELTTPVAGDRKEAISRLTQLASKVCAHSL